MIQLLITDIVTRSVGTGKVVWNFHFDKLIVYHTVLYNMLDTLLLIASLLIRNTGPDR